ncbi:MAG: serine/threonine protein kinase, partial [bacterium]
MTDFPDGQEGTTFEGWYLKRKLGDGNSAVVYHGEKDEHMGAVKIFRPSLIDKVGKRSVVDRIRRELELMTDIDHPSLAHVLDGDLGSAEHPYMVLECIEGFTIEDVGRRMPVDRIVPILAQIAGAARYLEEIGIVHRDIKPANIKVDPVFRKATLLDYGVIRPISDAHPDLTDTGDFVGTHRYSPPEFRSRLEDHSPEGWRAVTFYQLGAVAYELITGKQLYHNVNPVHYDATLPDFSTIRPGVPNELVELVKQCLCKEWSDRPTSWELFECRRLARKPVVVLVYTGGTIGATVDTDGSNLARLRVLQTKDAPFLAHVRSRLIRDYRQFAGPDAPLPFDLEWEILSPDKQLLSENAGYQTWN